MSSKVTLSRVIAFDAFVEVMERRHKPEEILEKLYDQHAKDLKRVDRNLTKEILYGGLRWNKKILWILQHTAKKRDLKTVSPQVRAALILGTYQIFYMDRVPDRAAVNESVEYIRFKGEAQAVPFVNGILRQIARRAEYFTKPDKKNKPVEYLALQFSHPEWMVKRWFERFNFERMETMLDSNNQPPPLFVRTSSKKIAPHVLQEQLLRDEQIPSEKGNLKGCLILKKHPPMTEDSLFGKGFYTIQDQASQVIPHLFDFQKPVVLLDAAAGPGGKLTHLCELAPEGSKIIAVEKNLLPLERAKENVQRLNFDSMVQWVHEDFLNYRPQEPVDFLLLDAPCTGMGVLRRHPEGKWHKAEAGISEVAQAQRKMIEHGLSLLKPGGELVYSICSFETEESEHQLRWVKDTYKDQVEVVSPVSRLPDYFKRYVTRDNILMIYAGNTDQMDGFSAFILKWKGPK